MEPKQEIDELLEKASWARQFSVEKSDILAQALKLAEAGNDKDFANSIREKYIDCLVFQGRNEAALPHFALVLAQLDNPEKPVNFFVQSMTLWRYKWFLTGLPNYTNVPKLQIMQTMEDVERRYLAFRSETAPTINYLKSRIYKALGESELASEHLRLFHEQEEEMKRFFSLSDCEACRKDSAVADCFDNQEWEQAIATAEPILTGKMSCESVPKNTYARLALAYCLLGQKEVAEDLYQKARKLIKEENQELTNASRLICYLVKNEKLPEAIELFEIQYPEALKTLNQTDVFHFFQAALFLFETLETGGAKSIAVQMPENAPIFSSKGEYMPGALVAHFQHETRRIAAAFDARNGNDYFSNIRTAWYANLRG